MYKPIRLTDELELTFHSTEDGQSIGFHIKGIGYLGCIPLKGYKRKICRYVALVFDDSLCAEVKEANEVKGLEINNNRWRYKEYEEELGKSRYVTERIPQEVIGVYDLNDLKHMNELIYAAKFKACKRVYPEDDEDEEDE